MPDHHSSCTCAKCLKKIENDAMLKASLRRRAKFLIEDHLKFNDDGSLDANLVIELMTQHSMMISHETRELVTAEAVRRAELDEMEKARLRMKAGELEQRVKKLEQEAAYRSTITTVSSTDGRMFRADE